MTPDEKLQEVCRLTELERKRIMDEIRAKHLHTSELELRCMFAYEWLGEEVAQKFWPYYVKDVEAGRIDLTKDFPKGSKPTDAQIG